ncbi:hypothetical protein ACFQ3Z_03825 [Streptomyces nogalater]
MSSSTGRRVHGTTAAVAVAVALTAVPALAPAAAAHVPAGAVPAAGPATTLVFDKNPDSPPTRSCPSTRGQTPGRLPRRWAPASRTTAPATKAGCPTGDGESGSRTLLRRPLIKGYAVHLQDMKCSKGTLTRTEMFIHSEMNRDGGQGSTESRRWDGDGDYASNGCVKLRPADIKEMFRLLNRIGWPTHLRVVS